MTDQLSDEEIVAVMRPILDEVDVQSVTFNEFMGMLSQKIGQDIRHRKKMIRDALARLVNEQAEMDEEEDSSSEADMDDQKTSVRSTSGGGGGASVRTGNAVKKQSSAKATGSGVKKEPSAKSTGTGLTAMKEISDELAAFIGQGKEMARTAIVKAMWEYIRSHELQNPNDKREILLDDRLEQLFKVPNFTMFTMNKYISAHIHPFPPVRFDTEEEKEAKRLAREGKKKLRKTKKMKVKRKPGMQNPYRLSAAMAAVVGKDIMPRPQITQGLWKYIRQHNLQNPQDKREIVCDDKLTAVMDGNSRVTMFSMSKFISAHMLEKLPKEMYVHPEQTDDNVPEGVDNDSDEMEGDMESDDE